MSDFPALSSRSILTKGVIKNFKRSLNDIIEYKINHGKTFSDDTVWKGLELSIAILSKCQNPYCDQEVYYTVFHFLATLDLNSEVLIGLILKSDLMLFIQTALIRSPEYIRKEALLAIKNLITSSNDEQILKFYDLNIIRSLFKFISLAQFDAFELVEIGNCAIVILRILYKKTEDALTRKLLNKM